MLRRRREANSILFTSPKSRLALARATSGSQSSELTKGTAMVVVVVVMKEVGERRRERERALCCRREGES